MVGVRVARAVSCEFDLPFVSSSNSSPQLKPYEVRPSTESLNSALNKPPRSAGTPT